MGCFLLFLSTVGNTQILIDYLASNHDTISQAAGYSTRNGLILYLFIPICCLLISVLIGIIIKRNIRVFFIRISISVPRLLIYGVPLLLCLSCTTLHAVSKVSNVSNASKNFFELSNTVPLFSPGITSPTANFVYFCFFSFFGSVLVGYSIKKTWVGFLIGLLFVSITSVTFLLVMHFS